MALGARTAGAHASTGRVAGVLTAMLAASVASGVALAAQSVDWNVTRQPTSVIIHDPTLITVRATNLSQSEQIGCILIKVPAPAFDVLRASITSQPAPDRVWSVSYASGSFETVVTAKAKNGGSSLRGGTERDTVGIGITVEGDDLGSHTWTAAAYSDTMCQTSKFLGLTASFTVAVSPPPATPTPKPTPRPTPTSSPSPNVTPGPTPTPRPGPTVPASSDPFTSPEPTFEPSGDASGEPDGSPIPETPPPATAFPAGGSGGTATPRPARGGTPGIGGWIGVGEDPFAVPVTDSERMRVDLSSAIDAGLLALYWGVPAIALSAPGVLIIIVVTAQTFGGLAWLPFVRRWIGGFGMRRRRPASTRPSVDGLR